MTWLFYFIFLFLQNYVVQWFIISDLAVEFPVQLEAILAKIS